MSIAEIVEKRKIESVLHFTTNRGSLGILASKAVKARKRLATDEQLAKIFYPNAVDRQRDAAWHDYVNLSLTQINEGFFVTSAGSWHKEDDLWWCIFDFSPEILSHNGVWFTTTNNMYSGVKRAEGAAGLEAAFSPSIVQWSSTKSKSVVERARGLPDNRTTCSQAEVLYPQEVSTAYLKKIYISRDTYADELAGQIAAVSHPQVSIEVRPDLFSSIK
jgi:hypothetical protein